MQKLLPLVFLVRLPALRLYALRRALRVACRRARLHLACPMRKGTFGPFVVCAPPLCYAWARIDKESPRPVPLANTTTKHMIRKGLSHAQG